MDEHNIWEGLQDSELQGTPFNESELNPEDFRIRAEMYHHAPEAADKPLIYNTTFNGNHRLNNFVYPHISPLSLTETTECQGVASPRSVETPTKSGTQDDLPQPQTFSWGGKQLRYSETLPQTPQLDGKQLKIIVDREVFQKT